MPNCSLAPVCYILLAHPVPHLVTNLGRSWFQQPHPTLDPSKDARLRPDFGSAFFVLERTLRIELDLDQLMGFFGRGYPFPFLNGVMSCLC